MSKFKREFKNVVYNYTDAEAKVREATSNDAWGPSSAIMSELAEYTFHVQAYGLVMGMLWKRLNDHGRNWRHVYKSLVVLDYLIKTGSERVTLQCKENLFSIQTLKDFQYIDKDGKDQGQNIREKAKGLVSLLKDDERLKDERKRALQARQRQTGLSSEQAAKHSPKNRPKVQFADGSGPDDSNSASAPVRREQNVEQARPNDETEEEMQLRLALELSKQQADEEERLKNQEDESLQAAIAMSKADGGGESPGEVTPPESSSDNLLLDFSETGLADPWTQPPELPPPSYDAIIEDPFAAGNSDPFASTTPTVDPFAGTTSSADPFAATSTAQTTAPATTDFWSIGGSIPPASGPPPTSSVSANPFDLSTLGGDLPPLTTTADSSKPKERIEDQFLGSGFGNLVDLDSLTIPPPILTNTASNPFGGPTLSTTANPFDSNKTVAPSLHQMASSNTGFGVGADLLPAPLLPVGGGNPRGGSPILPHTAMPQNQQNPFN